MGFLWSFLAQPDNQKTLSWLGGGAVVIIAGLWAAFVYFFPPKPEVAHDGGGAVAKCGSVAIVGNVTNASVVASPTTTTNCSPN